MINQKETYILKVFDKDGNELDAWRKKRFKAEFQSKKRAISFLRFYEEVHPELKFTIE